MISSMTVQVNSRNVEQIKIIPSECCDKLENKQERNTHRCDSVQILHCTNALGLVKNRVKDIRDLVHIIRLHQTSEHLAYHNIFNCSVSHSTIRFFTALDCNGLD